ncbi:TerD family protein [Solibaculum mannosilyticum]|uniref:Stress response protein SCP2 n=1 Tax=Solibaculum mannosilyticum TaxID=2780922 RepID=A0A7I8D291_9FIRM|nr:TerD family protein [Solibaculum mannosilyticum]BCI60950.1 stress response protein SCP2 [Solibaculum mannosilyticum]CZT55459.1 Stress response protein SCP2 [Eubacteriaceae bacterium CHKCI005]
MAVSLQKGQKVSLSKDNAGLGVVVVGLGWDEAQPARRGLFAPKPRPIDCDASAILCIDGKLQNPKDVVYFNNLRHASGAVQHMGDNLTGAGEGDDEQIIVDLSRLPEQYDRVIFAVNIYEARQRGQHFGMIKNSFIRLVDARGNKEMCRYNLSENYDGMTAMIFGEIYRHNGEWKFNAIGQPTNDDGLGSLVNRFR